MILLEDDNLYLGNDSRIGGELSLVTTDSEGRGNLESTGFDMEREGDSNLITSPSSRLMALISEILEHS